MILKGTSAADDAVYYLLGRTHTRQSVHCGAQFIGPGTVGGGGLHHLTDAHAQAQTQSADITATVVEDSP